MEWDEDCVPAGRHTGHEDEVAIVLVAREDAVENDREVGRDEEKRAETEHGQVGETPSWRSGMPSATEQAVYKDGRGAYPILLRMRMEIVGELTCVSAITSKGLTDTIQIGTRFVLGT